MIIIPGGFIATSLIFYIIWKYRKEGKLESEEFTLRYGALTEGTFPAGIIGSFWNVFILIRWILTIFILVVVRESYSI